MTYSGRLGWHEWGIPTQDLGEYPKGEHPVLDDPRQWAIGNPSLSIRLRAEPTISDERQQMSDDGFARERCGMWPALAEMTPRVIPQADWDKTGDENSRPSGRIAIAIDINLERTVGSIGLAGRRADGKPHVELAYHKAGVSWIVATVAGIVERRDPVDVVLDGASPAASLVPELRSVGIEPTITGPREMAAACGLIYDEITGHVLRHREDIALADAVGDVAKRDIGDGGFGWSRRRASGNIAPFVCVTLARWGLATHELPPAPTAPAPRALPASTSRVETGDLMSAGF